MSKHSDEFSIGHTSVRITADRRQPINPISIALPSAFDGYHTRHMTLTSAKCLKQRLEKAIEWIEQDDNQIKEF